MTETKARICYFDDDLQHREVVLTFLESEGFKVDVFADGAQAIIAAKQTRPDLILADILMPGMNGLLTVKQMRDGGIDSPVIFLTNFDKNDLDQSDLREMKVDRLLLKASTSFDTLLKNIEEVLESYKQGGAGAPSS